MHKDRLKAIFYSAFFLITIVLVGVVLQQNERTHRKFIVDKYERYERKEGVNIAYAEEIKIKENKVNEEDTGYININTADIDTLDKLPGIGEGLAKRIISYREENGDFEVVEDLMRVSGIGQKRFEEIRNLICVE
ncbi:MAG: helix-hairpin-helix domain-containing protein [Clostridia bacterium]|nr:helix-hairpin-helix domain-containing protein [Clostridia bacterium]